MAHELGHVLTNAGHTNDCWRIMHWTTRFGVTGSRRFVTEEENIIKGNPHVQ